MLVRGDQLSESARRQVLAAFGYRWTTENESRARQWYRNASLDPPRSPLIPDEQWLREHAFHVVQDGSRLMKNRSRVEPACMLEDGATP